MMCSVAQNYVIKYELLYIRTTVRVYFLNKLLFVVIIHRRSIVEHGGYFQRRLFVSVFVCLSVCQYVCQQDNFRTTKRRTIKLGD